MPQRLRSHRRQLRAGWLAHVLSSVLLAAVVPIAAAQESPAGDGAATVEPQRQDLAFALPAGQPIAVDNPYGSVYLRFGGYAHELGLHTTLQQPAGAPAIAFAPGAAGGRFVIAPQLPKGATLARGQRLDIVVYVPRHHAVTVRTGDGGIESRGVKSDLDLRSVAGSIAVRDTDGTVQAETGDGTIEVALDDTARPGARQRLATTTGNLIVGVTDRLDAQVHLATSGTFATDYSLQVEHRDGEEPNKAAIATIGAPRTGKDLAEVVLDSRRGEIRLLRRAVFVEADGPEPEHTNREDHRDVSRTGQ